MIRGDGTVNKTPAVAIVMGSQSDWETMKLAADVCAQFTCAGWHDLAALERFASQCAVVTYEVENVPVEPLAVVRAATRLHPHCKALEVAQDRVAEKTFVEPMGGRPAPWAPVSDMAGLAIAIDTIGAPGILKTRRDGYDGKGQWRIMTPADIDSVPEIDRALVYEGLVRFASEFSVLLVRGADGDVRFWDSPENRHNRGILARSTVPASSLIASQIAEARALAGKIAAELEYVGVLAVEFFATEAGPVFNEMAPRVHNSGHWTIEGALTSQFENHIRAICGLPLGDCALAAKGVVMDNLIGDDAHDWHQILSDPCNHLHLYGKAAVRPGRKMGHVTRLTL